MTRKTTITLCREIDDIPAEIELQVECEYVPGSRGYFNHITGDCDPPSNAEVWIENRYEIEAYISWLFDGWKAETIKRVNDHLDSAEFVADVEEELRGSDE